MEKVSGVFLARIGVESRKKTKTKTRTRSRRRIKQEIEGSITELETGIIAKAGAETEKESIDDIELKVEMQKDDASTSKQTEPSLRIRSVHRMPINTWDELQEKQQLVPKDPETVIQQLGFSNVEAFDARVQSAITKTIRFQDDIRSRVRGTPVTSKSQTWTITWSGENYITLPQELVTQLKNQLPEQVQLELKLELLSGSDDYLLYVKRR